MCRFDLNEHYNHPIVASIAVSIQIKPVGVNRPVGMGNYWRILDQKLAT